MSITGDVFVLFWGVIRSFISRIDCFESSLHLSTLSDSLPSPRRRISPLISGLNADRISKTSTACHHFGTPNSDIVRQINWNSTKIAGRRCSFLESKIPFLRPNTPPENPRHVCQITSRIKWKGEACESARTWIRLFTIWYQVCQNGCGKKTNTFDEWVFNVSLITTFVNKVNFSFTSLKMKNFEKKAGSEVWMDHSAKLGLSLSN